MELSQTKPRPNLPLIEGIVKGKSGYLFLPFDYAQGAIRGLSVVEARFLRHPLIREESKEEAAYSCPSPDKGRLGGVSSGRQWETTR